MGKQAMISLDMSEFALKAKLAAFKASHALDLWSLFISLVAALGVFFTAPLQTIIQGFFWLSLILSLVQKYYAMRVQYDIALFEAWLSVQSPTLVMLDEVLYAQFGIKPSSASLSQPVEGVESLFYRQMIVLSLQMLSTVVALVLFYLESA